MRVSTKLARARATSFLGIAVLGFAAFPSHAQDGGGKSWYLAAGGSLTFAEKMDFEMPYGMFSNVNIDLFGHKNFKTGWGLTLSAGRPLGDNLRIEGEVLWHRVSLDNIERTHRFGRPLTPEEAANTGRDIQDSGKFSVWTSTANLYYDFPAVGRLRPYLGGGLGFAHGTMSLDVRTRASAPHQGLDFLREALEQGTAPSQAFHEDTDRWDFVWSVRAGANFELSPALTLGAGYRFMHLPSTSFSFAEERLTEPVSVTVSPFHTFDLSLRWSF